MLSCDQDGREYLKATPEVRRLHYTLLLWRNSHMLGRSLTQVVMMMAGHIQSQADLPWGSDTSPHIGSQCSLPSCLVISSLDTATPGTGTIAAAATTSTRISGIHGAKAS